MLYRNPQSRTIQKIRKDPCQFVDDLHDFYSACEKSYHEEKRDLLQECAILAEEMKQDNEIFLAVMRHPFWLRSRQKPKLREEVKCAVYSMLRPNTRKSRNVAGKYAAVIADLAERGCFPTDVAKTLEEVGGINWIYNNRKGNWDLDERAKNRTKKSSNGHMTFDESSEHQTEFERQDDTSISAEKMPSSHEKHRKKVANASSLRVVPGWIRRKFLLIEASESLMSKVPQTGYISIRVACRLSKEGGDKWINLCAKKIHLR